MHCLAKGVRVVCDTMTALWTLESRIRSAMFLMVLTPTLPSSAKNTKICSKEGASDLASLCSTRLVVAPWRSACTPDL